MSRPLVTAYDVYTAASAAWPNALTDEELERAACPALSGSAFQTRRAIALARHQMQQAIDECVMGGLIHQVAPSEDGVPRYVASSLAAQYQLNTQALQKNTEALDFLAQVLKGRVIPIRRDK